MVSDRRLTNAHRPPLAPEVVQTAVYARITLPGRDCSEGISGGAEWNSSRSSLCSHVSQFRLPISEFRVRFNRCYGEQLWLSQVEAGVEKRCHLETEALATTSQALGWPQELCAGALQNPAPVIPKPTVPRTLREKAGTN